MSQSRSPQEIRIQNEINHKKIANVHENRATEILFPTFHSLLI